MAIRDILKKAMVRDPRLKEMQEERKLMKMVEEREKSADERELERFYEEERQKTIKKNLEEFRKHQREEAWSSKNTILNQPNIFKGGKSIMDQDFNILDDKKKLFTGKGNMLKGGGFK
jgi:predicted RecB family nuclease